MITNHRRSIILALLKVSDLAVLSLVFAFAICLAMPGEQWVSLLEMRVKLRNVLFMIGYLGYWHLVLLGFGLYRSYRLAPISREWRDLGAAVVVAAFPLYLFGYALRFEFATPHFFVNFFLLAVAGLGLERRAFRALARSMRRHGHNLRNAVIVGDGRGALDMASRLARRGDLGYRIVEVLEVQAVPRMTDECTASEAAVLERVGELIERHPVDEVFVGLPLDAGLPLVRALVQLCEEQGITVRMVSTVVDLILAKAQVDEVDGRPVVTIFTGPPDSPMLAVKRFVDVVVSTVALIVLAPVLGIVAAAIWLDSGRPVLFVQERVGLNGRRFRFFKFRTMVQGAELLQSKIEHLNEAEGPVFKIRNDPRITSVGRVIRRLSLDELPQLFNVLVGDMSLVGPRPLPVRDVERFQIAAHKRRFSVKPGITCLWQISGREPQFDSWVKTDMEYIDNWSLALDFKILVKTIPAVLSGRGAY